MESLSNVGTAQKKAERQAELKAKFQQGRDGKVDKPQGINLYLKNLDDSINDEELKKLDKRTTLSTASAAIQHDCVLTILYVMVDSKGRSKNSGFVSFTTAEAGHNAINGMNGKMVGKKPLYVGLHQPKDQRRAMLTAHFAQGNLAMAAVPFTAPQHVYFGHPALGQIPFRSMHPSQRMGARHGTMSPQMYRQQQMMIHPNANQGVRMAAALTSALASASPTEQQKMLGNKLYPLVEQLEPNQASKVTGMLLEMDKLEILHLPESPEALRAKVCEAMVVLQRSIAGGSADPVAAVAAPAMDA
ncbi:Polyadenylate-binding protein, cytoplasmic and nuclear [Dichanthelium oligosanthes]|uniref:Polyadenylate-binding protein, cytoplasmic and nuclear n=1 Tax=Dichanthelium oligosanthes TaxID=888268 RepID=A0A1E5VYP3_9POAL|nr:Polyadenylate-binding protein, cytoplasmic and nuclear [Dichanthelium oligosanthes]